MMLFQQKRGATNAQRHQENIYIHPCALRECFEIIFGNKKRNIGINKKTEFHAGSPKK